VEVVNQDRGARVGLQHLELGEQAQGGLLANPAVSRWLKSSRSQTEQGLDSGIFYAVSQQGISRIVSYVRAVIEEGER
jgi:uncharacterized phage infection (PIP) family protein YhgE